MFGAIQTLTRSMQRRRGVIIGLQYNRVLGSNDANQRAAVQRARRSALSTTLALDSAIAAPAIAGDR